MTSSPRTTVPFTKWMRHVSAITSALSLSLSISLLRADPAHAQTGDWTDGEIIVRSTIAATGERALFRVVPESGATALLTTTQYWGGWAGSMVFDSHRGGLLSNMSKPPDGTFTYRLWLVSHDGTSTAMPGFTGDLKALASAGDGRVFFIRHTGSTQGPKTIEYFDANDSIHTLKQNDGITPFEADVEHLLYDPSSNVLIGSSSAQWAATHCSPTGSSLYRFPLSADGMRVEGAIACTSIPTTLLYGDIMALDRMPDGNVLVTTATAFLGAPHNMLSVNPVTLAANTWASPAQHDINGGFWSARLGRSIIYANSGSAWWIPDGLHSLSAGEASFGVAIPTSLPLPGGGGFSPYENMVEVDLLGPGCHGFQIPYGAGLAGNGGFVPMLGLIGCPDLGNVFTLSINGVVGGANGVLIAGIAAGSVPFFGGTFHIGGPILVVIPLTLAGTPGLANAGSLALPAVLTDPVMSGLDIHLQGAFVDVAAIHDVSLTNGLRFQAN